MTAAVVGASGYTGGELLRLLSAHPQLQPTVVMAKGSAGRSLGDVHPHLVGLGDVTVEPTDPSRLATVDVVFLALPHGESAAVAAQIPEGPAVVDLAADFRLVDAERWSSYYGTPHSGCWTYGLPELAGQRDRIIDSRRVANPGCFATAVAVALSPLVGPLGADSVVVVAASGTSGAGRQAAPSLLGSEVMGSISAYKVGGTHQHTPEMEQSLSGAARHTVVVSFTPLLAPMSRGILATCSFPTRDGVTTAEVRQLLLATYSDEPFVSVLPEGQWPRTADVLGSNAAHLQAVVDSRAGRVVVVSAIDNLGKGAAGQAVQNANLVLGLAETTGLSVLGIAP